MKYPKRLIAQEGEAGDIARSILSDSELGAPAPAAMRAVWAGLGARLAQPTHAGPESNPLPHGHPANLPQAPTPHSGIVQAARAGLSLVKATVVATLVAGAGLTAVLLQPSEQAATQTAHKPAPSIREANPNSVPSSMSPQAPASAMPPSPVGFSPAVPLASNPGQTPARAVRVPLQSAVDNAEVTAPNATPELGESSKSGKATTAPASAGRFPDATAAREAPSAMPSTGQLLRETALLEQGRAALRAGNAGQAWRALEQWAAEFPVAQLNQEREVLTIELLWRSGRRDLARERIRAFARDYPNSAHAARLKALLEP